MWYGASDDEGNKNVSRLLHALTFSNHVIMSDVNETTKQENVAAFSSVL